MLFTKIKKKSLVNSLNEELRLQNIKIIWLDADYSHPPELIEKFLNIFNHNEIDLIVGSRFREAKDIMMKKIEIQ